MSICDIILQSASIIDPDMAGIEKAVYTYFRTFYKNDFVPTAEIQIYYYYFSYNQAFKIHSYLSVLIVALIYRENSRKSRTIV